MMDGGVSPFEAAGRAFFRGIYGEENSASAVLFELIGGKVAARFKALRDWDAVDLEGLEDAKHNPCLTEADGVYLCARLREISSGNLDATYHRMWSDAVEIAKAEWPAIVDLARSLSRPSSMPAGNLPSWTD